MTESLQSPGLVEMARLLRKISADITARNGEAVIADAIAGLRMFELNEQADALAKTVAALESKDWKEISKAIADDLYALVHLAESMLHRPVFFAVSEEDVVSPVCLDNLAAALEGDTPNTHASAGMLNRVYMARIRIELAVAACNANPKVYFFATLKRAKAELSDETISKKAEAVQLADGTKIPVGSLGDGTLWATIVAFFQTPQGLELKKLLLQALGVLLGLLIL